jgi:hypothetical protein
MNFAYDPKIAALDRGLRELHLPGQGREAGAREDRSGRGEQHADLPDERDARQRHNFDAAALNNEKKYITEWQNLISS